MPVTNIAEYNVLREQLYQQICMMIQKLLFEREFSKENMDKILTEIGKSNKFLISSFRGIGGSEGESPILLPNTIEGYKIENKSETISNYEELYISTIEQIFTAISEFEQTQEIEDRIQYGNHLLDMYKKWRKDEKVPSQIPLDAKIPLEIYNLILEGFKREIEDHILNLNIKKTGDRKKIETRIQILNRALECIRAFNDKELAQTDLLSEDLDSYSIPQSVE